MMTIQPSIPATPLTKSLPTKAATPLSFGSYEKPVIGILTDKPLGEGYDVASVELLLNAAKEKGYPVEAIRAQHCAVHIKDGKLQILHNNKPLKKFDVIFPFIGSNESPLEQYQMNILLKALEDSGQFTTTDTLAGIVQLDKTMASIAMAKHGISQPDTFFLSSKANKQPTIDSFREGRKTDVIFKEPDGRRGEQVWKVPFTKLGSEIDKLRNNETRYFMQEFVKESNAEHIRVIVIGDKIVARMLRGSDQKEDFRSNAAGKPYAKKLDLPQEEIAEIDKLSIAAAKAANLPIGAGIDLIKSNRGWLVCEVNGSPGLKRITDLTGINVAGSIIDATANAFRQKEDAKKLQLNA